MSTHATIGAYDGEGNLTYVYLHCDGNYAECGKILYESYNHIDRVFALLSFGNISVLGPEIGARHPFTPEDRPKGECTFYGRDRGESVDDIGSITVDSIIDMDLFDYNYVFEDGEWYTCRKDGAWSLLRTILYGGVVVDVELGASVGPNAFAELQVAMGRLSTRIDDTHPDDIGDGLRCRVLDALRAFNKFKRRRGTHHPSPEQIAEFAKDRIRPPGWATQRNKADPIAMLTPIGDTEES